MADVRKVEIVVSATDATAAGFASVNARLDAMAAAVAKTVQGLGIGYLIKQVFDYAEAWSTATNRLKVATGSAQAAAAVQEKLLDVANRTRSDLTSQVELYQRLSTSQKTLGASSAKMIQFTEAVGLALATSGASGAAASGSLLQLSQALGSGNIRAQEFNSMMMGTPRLVQAAADGITRFHGNIGLMRAEMSKGKLTSKEFFEGILSQQAKLQAEFDRTAPTMGAAFTVVGTQIMALIGHMDEATSTTESLARGMIFLANHIEIAAKAAGIFAAVLAVMFLPMTIALLQGLALGLVSILAPVAAFIGLFGAIPIAIAAAITYLILFRDSIFPISGSLASLGDYGEAAFNAIGQALSWVGGQIADVAATIGGKLGPSFQEVGKFMDELVDAIKGTGTWMKTLANNIISFLLSVAASAIIVSDQMTKGFQTFVRVSSDALFAFAEDLDRLWSSGFKDRSFSAVRQVMSDATDQFRAIHQETVDKIKVAITDQYKTDFVGALADAAIGGLVAIGDAWQIEAERIARINLGLFEDFSAKLRPPLVEPGVDYNRVQPEKKFVPTPPPGPTDKEMNAAAKAAARYEAALLSMGDAARKSVVSLFKLNATQQDIARVTAAQELVSAVEKIEANEAKAIVDAQGNADKLKAIHAASTAAITANINLYHATILKNDKVFSISREKIARDLEVALTPRLGRSVAAEAAAVKDKWETLQRLIEEQPELEATIKLVQEQTISDWKAAAQQQLDLQALELKVVISPRDRGAAGDLALMKAKIEQDAEREKLIQIGNTTGIDVSENLRLMDAAWVQQTSNIQLANSAMGDFLATFKGIGEDAVKQFASGTADAFINFIKGSEGAGEAFREFAGSMLENIAKLIIQTLVLYAVQLALNAIMGKSTVGAGTQLPADIKYDYTPAATGGIVRRPTFLLAGEGGEPEMILPLSKAKEQGFGGGEIHVTTIVNVAANGTPTAQTSQQGSGASATAMARAIKLAVIDVIHNEQRNGGSLASTRRS